MEYVIGLIIALVGGLIFYKNRADKYKADSLISFSEGRDKELKEQQDEIEKAISEIDVAIGKIKNERKQRREDLSDRERADKWK